MQQSQEQKNTENTEQKDKVLSEILKKIRESDSILVALSNNPSIDELATAMGLTMYIDALGKHATAIYSGATPNVLAFLNPEQKFETNTNSLQDFIIAINKDKADHLRYKLDGDYVKVYITPYRTTISENDLEFSHGDYNVDLVIALNVENSDQLDGALAEHGRIMHDAEIINIAAGVPGKFGEIQWSDPGASSVAEMVTKLVFEMKDVSEINKDVATTLLTGIVAATERFSNNRTQPDTMNIVAELMKFGADQQLISANIMKNEESKAFEVDRGGDQNPVEPTESKAPVDETVLDVQNAKHDDEVVTETPVESEKDESQEKSEIVQPLQSPVEAPAFVGTENVGDDISAGIGSQTIINRSTEKVDLKPLSSISLVEATNPVLPQVQDVAVPSDNNVMPEASAEVSGLEENNGVGGFEEMSSALGTEYKNVIDDNMSELNTQSEGNEPIVTPEPLVQEEAPKLQNEYIGSNPALAAAPGVSAEPEENQVPKLSFDQPVSMSDEDSSQGGSESYLNEQSTKVLNPISELPSVSNESSGTLEEKPVGMPLPGEDILPPPPTPPIDFSDTASVGGQTTSNTIVEPLVNPVSQSTTTQEQSADPGAFKIPGM